MGRMVVLPFLCQLKTSHSPEVNGPWVLLIRAICLFTLGTLRM